MQWFLESIFVSIVVTQSCKYVNIGGSGNSETFTTVNNTQWTVITNSSLKWIYKLSFRFPVWVIVATYLFIHIFPLYHLSADNTTKLSESGVLCGNIADLGWQMDTWAHRAQVICCHLKQCDIAIQYTRWRLFCFYILLFNG